MIDENEKIEQWRDIAGYEGLYQVSDAGGVRSWLKSKRKWKDLQPYDNGHGYLQLALCKHGERIMVVVHRLVLLAFVPNTHGYLECNHRDGNKANNRVENLEWCWK